MVTLRFATRRYLDTQWVRLPVTKADTEIIVVARVTQRRSTPGPVMHQATNERDALPLSLELAAIVSIMQSVAREAVPRRACFRLDKRAQHGRVRPPRCLTCKPP